MEWVVTYPLISSTVPFRQSTNSWASAGGANVSMTFKRSSWIAFIAASSMRAKLLDIIALKRRETDIAKTMFSTGSSETVCSSSLTRISRHSMPR